jgi:hypothetical protein
VTATTTSPQRTAKRWANSEWADRLARLGFCARGLVYIIIGVLAFQIASTGGGDEEASKDGALREIAERSFGTLLLGVLALGLAGYALWRFTEALWGKQDEEDEKKRTAKRLLSFGKGVLYTLLLVSTLRFMANGPSEGQRGGNQREQSLTARALDLPAGQWIVGLVGAGIIVAGCYLVYRGAAQKFEKRLDTAEMGPMMGPVVEVLGTVGLVARGVVVGLLGFLVLKAALDYDPEQAVGLDGTLRTIASQTYGQVLLTVTAIGVIAYGLYSFAEARYREL